MVEKKRGQQRASHTNQVLGSVRSFLRGFPYLPQY
ncbi:hypothetical protein AWRI1631_51090 [Saccharomyces cerevisiae AWRI1631]|uniref:Uncharacterized protein n=1 Tax=Saccharomyces cerevisiae (strain AWRI1631) TaxID=545124 RepID=B5VHH2_YEAS6|nr:hypothetical protein AWRI1631_51090 [Saccharomyces cerevisiae AWRI1631]